MWKRCEISLKRCEIVDIEEFSLENLYAKHIYSCSAQVGGSHGTNENLIRCEKGVKLPEKGVKSLI